MFLGKDNVLLLSRLLSSLSSEKKLRSQSQESPWGARHAKGVDKDLAPKRARMILMTSKRRRPSTTSGVLPLIKNQFMTIFDIQPTRKKKVNFALGTSHAF